MGPNELHFFISESQEARKFKNFAKAEYLINLMLEYNKHSDSVQLEYAAFLKDMQKYIDALKILFRISHGPKKNLVLMEIIDVFYVQQKYGLAYKYATKLYEETKSISDKLPFTLYALNKMADCCKNYGKTIKAKKLYQQLLTIIETKGSFGIDKYNILTSLGDIALLDGEVQNAINYYKEVIHNSILYKPYALYKCGTILANNKQYDEALEYFNASNEEPRSLLETGKIYVSQRNFNDAFIIFNQLINTPLYVEAMEQLIYLYYKQEEFNQALMHIQELIKYLQKQRICNIDLIKNMKQLKRIIQIYLGVDYNETAKEKESKELELVENYILEKAISHIKRNIKHTKNSSFNISVSEILKMLDFNEDSYYETQNFDIYYFQIPNVGTINNTSTDFIKVETIINTTNVVNIYPCTNRNNQYKCSKNKKYKKVANL